MHGNISRNGYGNAIIGRYGGCFEEGGGLCVGEQEEVLSTGFGCTGEVCTISQGEIGQCTVPKRLAKRCIGGSALKTATYKQNHIANTS